MEGHGRVNEKLKAIKREELSAEENIARFLDKIRKEDKKINSFIFLNKNALAEAKAVDKKIKAGKAGKLSGLAIAVKSNINVQEMLTSCASKTLSNYYATYDADVIEAIKREDGIIIGMTNMDEFACGSSGETSFYGPTDNPSANGKIPGGSSSGSAAAIAANFCDIALGSDTGGSIRNPASHCGVCGIKPSYGRVSRYGFIDMAMSLEQIGPLSKNVFESALLFSITAGKSVRDASTINASAENYAQRMEEKPKNLKLALVDEFLGMGDKKISNLIEEKAKKLAQNYGWQLKRISLKHVDLAIQTYYPLVYVEFFSSTRKFDGRRYGYRIEETCGPEVLRRILGGSEISKAEYRGRYYKKALVARKLITEEFEKALREVDCIITPVVPKLPHKIGSVIEDPKVMYAYDAFTIPANLSGIAAGVLQGGRINEIPVGIQFMTKAFSETLLLQIMHAYEVLTLPKGL